jgi:fructan beta-fructosidase
VLIVNIGSKAAAGGSGGQYFIGSFDGRTFLNENPSQQTLWVDHGADFYAGVTWSDVPASDGRRILLGWLNNWQYAQDIPTSPWRSSQSIPRTLGLRATPEGIRLVQQPVQELQRLREAHQSFSSLDFDDATDLNLRGNQLEILVDVALNGAPKVELAVLAGDAERTVVGYDAVEGEVYIDRSASGVGDFHESFLSRHAAPLAAPDGRIRLHVFVDWSSVEVFADDGLAVLTDRVFPRASSQDVRFTSQGGTARIESLDVWTLRSIWNRPAQ